MPLLFDAVEEHQTMPSIARRGYIYFILDHQAGAIKIGHSTNVQERLATLQTASSTKLVLLGSMLGTVPNEQRLHTQFKRVHGEWFRPTPDLWQYIVEHATTTNVYDQYRQYYMSQTQPIQPTAPHDVETERTGLALLHHFMNIVLMGLLTLTSLWMLVDLLIPLIPSGVVRYVGSVTIISVYVYIWVWAMTYRYRNDRKPVKQRELTSQGRVVSSALKQGK